jgi:hypothetical protein
MRKHVSHRDKILETTILGLDNEFIHCNKYENTSQCLEKQTGKIGKLPGQKPTFRTCAPSLTPMGKNNLKIKMSCSDALSSGKHACKNVESIFPLNKTAVWYNATVGTYLTYIYIT